MVHDWYLLQVSLTEDLGAKKTLKGILKCQTTFAGHIVITFLNMILKVLGLLLIPPWRNLQVFVTCRDLLAFRMVTIWL